MTRDFKDIFVHILQYKKISAYKLSADTGITQGLISQWRAGTRIPASDNLNKLADYFDVTTDYLLGRDETNPPHTLPPELNAAQTAFSGINGEGLNEDDIEMLLDVAKRLKKKNQNQ